MNFDAVFFKWKKSPGDFFWLFTFENAFSVKHFTAKIEKHLFSQKNTKNIQNWTFLKCHNSAPDQYFVKQFLLSDRWSFRLCYEKTIWKIGQSRADLWTVQKYGKFSEIFKFRPLWSANCGFRIIFAWNSFIFTKKMGF